MPEMNLIMENWNKFLHEDEKEDLAQLKKSPKEVQDLIGQIVQADRDQQKVAANFLIKDPEVQAATNIIDVISEDTKED